MAERLSNLGYLALVKQTDPFTPATPTDYIPFYDETLTTKANFIDLDPIYGNKYGIFNTIQGQRSHGGDITTIAEPNTTARLLDMLLTRTSTTGSGPTYTHTFGLSNTVNPNGYTIDISTGNVVSRYWGVQAHTLAETFSNNEKRHKLSISALGSFQGRDIASVSTNTITLSTAYDAAPNKGLVAGDLVQLYKSSTGATLQTTITTVNADGITVVLGTSAAAFAPGDIIHLRPAVPSFSALIQTPFLWAKTYYKYGATASAAASAAQFRVDDGSTFTINHNFESNDGSRRSGGFDPAALIRTTGKLDIKVKKYFDTPEDIIAFNNLSKSALVVQQLAGPANQYNMTLTANHIKTDDPVPNLKADGTAYSEINYHPIYDLTDATAFNVSVTNTLATI